MAKPKNIHDGWGQACDHGWDTANSENGREEIVQGWGNAGENKNKRKVTQWEHAGDLDNFVPIGNNTAQKGKRPAWPASSTSRGRPQNGPKRFRGKGDFCNGNGRGEWKGKRAASNEIGGNGWKGKRAASNEIGGNGWNRKRAASNEIGGNGKRASSNGIGGNGGSQVSNGGNRVGNVQTLGNHPHGLNGHRISLHFPVQSPQLQKILREDFSLPDPCLGFLGQINNPRPRPNPRPNPRPRQVNGPPPPPTPPLAQTPPPAPANAVQVFRPPVMDRVLSRKVRVTHSTEGSWVMEVEEYN